MPLREVYSAAEDRDCDRLRKRIEILELSDVHEDTVQSLEDLLFEWMHGSIDDERFCDRAMSLVDETDDMGRQHEEEGFWEEWDEYADEFQDEL